MFRGNKEYTYKIKLPAYVTQEVLDWFENLAYRNALSDELMVIVQEHLKSARPKETPITEINTEVNLQCLQECSNSPKENIEFFDRLYNWQESNNSIFVEEKIKKKKMLLV